MSLASMAVASAIFVHFEHPETKEPLYVKKDQINPDTKQVESVDDLSKPIGVRCYTPGSKAYRKAETDNMTAMVAAKGKTNGEQIFRTQTDLLAKTVYEYVNFDYNGKGASVENNREFFSDEQYVACREQVIAKQGDLGNASKARSTV